MPRKPCPEVYDYFTEAEIETIKALEKQLNELREERKAVAFKRWILMKKGYRRMDYRRNPVKLVPYAGKEA